MIKISEELLAKFNANPLYSKDGQGINAEVIAKFYVPFSEACWLITEASQEGDDWLMFGYCHIFEWEFGYVSLSEIMELNINIWYLQPIITQYFIDNKSEIWLLFLIAHSKR